jgi:hypothetical protein
MEQQKYEPCNSRYMKTYVSENCGLNPFTREKLPPTCQLKDYPHMIDNITTFLCHIIPNNNNNDIELSDISTGEIINRGSFGYTFGLKDKNFIIKIIVCLPNLENMTKLLKNEIEIHSLLSKYDTINYIQLYGYYSKKDGIYNYHDISRNTSQKIIFGDKEILFETNCEIYLIMHKGLNDVASYIGRIFDDYTLTTFITDIQDIYDLLNAFKVSNLILENKGKIFIHSDIKAENIVRAMHYNQEKYNLKLIDFGLSKLSNKFFVQSSDGTELIFKILFTHQLDLSGNGKREIYDNRLSMISPLFDIFSIILVMFELFIKHRMNTLEYNIYKINEIIIEYTFKLKEKNNILYQNIRRLLIIFNSIYDFHQNKLEQYYKDVIASESLVGWLTGFLSKDPLQKYINSYDMADFKLSDIDDNTTKPKYNVSDNKLKDDMDYLTNLISFCMQLQFD